MTRTMRTSLSAVPLSIFVPLLITWTASLLELVLPLPLGQSKDGGRSE